MYREARIAQLSRPTRVRNSNTMNSLVGDKDQKTRMLQCRKLTLAVANKRKLEDSFTVLSGTKLDILSV